jgi:hypothetical protein
MPYSHQGPPDFGFFSSSVLLRVRLFRRPAWLAGWLFRGGRRRALLTRRRLCRARAAGRAAAERPRSGGGRLEARLADTA